MSATTGKLHWKTLVGFNGVAFGVIGFVLVGLVCLGSVAFGGYQIATRDTTGGNNSGEVLTVLGLYFSVPYLLILGAFLYTAFDFNVVKKGASFWTHNTTLAVVILLFIVQQGFSDVYLVLLHGPGALTVLIADLVVLVMLFVWQLCPNTCVAYVILFGLKMGLIWGQAYTLLKEPVFGPSGFAAMLFICIPIIQMTLFSPSLENEGISQAFVSRFNIAMTHLLHSLDIISFFAICFKPLEGGGIAQLKPIPIPLRWTMLVLSLIAFGANNLGIPLLFFRSKFRRITLPQPHSGAGDSIMAVANSSVSHRDFHLMADPQLNSNESFYASGAGGGGGGGDEQQGRDSSSRGSGSGSKKGEDGDANTAAAVLEYNENEQMMTFMLLMMMLCDFPFLAARFALWGTQVERMDVFAAKNIKAMLDVCMLLTRSRDF